MQPEKTERPDRRLITIYAPIFREKLKKLERCGQGFTAEAMDLRSTLAQIEHEQTGSSGKDERSAVFGSRSSNQRCSAQVRSGSAQEHHRERS